MECYKTTFVIECVTLFTHYRATLLTLKRPKKYYKVYFSNLILYLNIIKYIYQTYF